MTAVDVDRRIAWRETGPASPAETIVFLHGLGGTRTAWEPQLASLSDAYRCVAWDMPGYGASAPLETLTFATIADSLVSLLDHLAVGRAHLVGLSFGGMHALHTALRHPDRVASMVLCGTSPAFGIDGTDAEEWKRLRLDALDAGRTPADIAQAVLSGVAGPALGSEVLEKLVASMSRISSAGLIAAVECLPTHDIRSRLDKITAPTLVVVGELDVETPLAYSQLIADGIAGATLEVLSGVGHLSPSEAPDRVCNLIRSHLAQSDSTTQENSNAGS